jgi:Tol biopolymer transport system component
MVVIFKGYDPSRSLAMNTQLVRLGFVSVALTAAPLFAQSTARISVGPLGVQANSNSYSCSLSGDGQSIAFFSDACNLVNDDTNGVKDVFVRDLLLGATQCISVDSNGMQSNGYSSKASISASGRVVAFDSGASNLVGGDTNACTDVFVHDIVTGITTRASGDTSDVQGDRTSHYPSISSDGRFVAFESSATALVPGRVFCGRTFRRVQEPRQQSRQR